MCSVRTFAQHNIELSSAADHAPRSVFLTGLNQQFQPAPKATAPTICYVGSDFKDASCLQTLIMIESGLSLFNVRSHDTTLLLSR
jgi:hypothetical protein